MRRLSIDIAVNQRRISPIPEEKTELLCENSEKFRSRLINEFHLVDNTSSMNESELTTERPTIELDDVMSDIMLKRYHYLRVAPYGLVKFQTNKHSRNLPAQNSPDIIDQEVMSCKKTGGRNRMSKTHDKRQLRVKYRMGRNWLTRFQVYVGKLIHAPMFDTFILIMVLLNSVSLGVQTETHSMDSRGILIDQHPTLNFYLDWFDSFCLLIFVLEILFKWLGDDMSNFWQSGWNVFDFFVTLVSLLPEIMRLATPAEGASTVTSYMKLINNIRIMRVFRSLKTVSRIESVRLLVAAILNAFSAMLFITLLLIVFLYIFAVFGVTMFRGNTLDLEPEARKQHVVWNRFGTIWAAMATLFQIFTLDNWLQILKETANFGGLLMYVYIILWIVIGSFIFNNLFVGIMVNNFQSIRDQLIGKVAKITKATSIAKDVVANVMKKASSHAIRLVTDEDELDDKAWLKSVNKDLNLLRQQVQETVWPSDTMFQYMLLMEHLTENLAERKRLLMLSRKVLASMCNQKI